MAIDKFELIKRNTQEIIEEKELKEILKKKKLSGMENYIVEQDRTFDGMEPMEAIKISH